MLTRSVLRAAVVAVTLVAGAAWPANIGAAADTTGPVPEPPMVTFRTAQVRASGVPVLATWAVSDPSGIASHEVQLRIDGGSWVPQALDHPGRPRATVRVPAPHEGQLRVRATDRAGNTGPWVTGSPFRVRRYAETSDTVTRHGSWSTVRSDGFLGGTALRSTTVGDSLDIEIEGKVVALVARQAPAGGSVAMGIEGGVAERTPLWWSSVRERMVLGRVASDEGVTRTLHVEVAHATVWFDGYVVLDDAPADPVLVGAGDIATCGLPGDNRTAKLLDGIAGRVFAAGDVVYPTGSAAQFRDCYDPTWGRWRLRTSPAVGNHEYKTSGAAPYWTYFGSRAGVRGKGWYAYDLGTWRVYTLNANCTEVGCGPGSEQVRWLAADLAANPRACVAAVWHQPLFSSGEHGNNADVRTLWQTLEDAGAELVLNGHDHDYERFAAQRADGTAAADGMVEFVVGTGGGPLRPFGSTIRPNSLVRQHSAFGVLKLTLRDGGYDFAWVGEPGSTFADSGTATCH